LSNIFAATFTSILATGDKEGLVKEVRFSFKILAVFLTVPFAGIIIFGQKFFALWLPSNVYDNKAIKQVYILMLLTLINVIINAYMYSIHALLIALDKVKVYSIMVFGCSIVSICSTLSLVKFTNLGVYAVAGVSLIGSVIVAFIVMMVSNSSAKRKIQQENVKSVDLIKKQLGEKKFEQLIEARKDYTDRYFAALYPEDEIEEEVSEEVETIETPEAEVVETVEAETVEAEVVEEVQE
jgi:hypothetical protein